MHFEILVEDVSGKTFLDIVVPKILSDGDTFSVHPYKGIGRVPAGLGGSADPKKMMLLTQLPRLLQGYGNAFSNYPAEYSAAVIVVCDLDRRNKDDFLRELVGVLDRCIPKPEARFCLAIEEGEAWLLGDLGAIRSVYPNAREKILTTYINDSICGTWEVLADAIYPGGAEALSEKGFHEVGKLKSEWAMRIAPQIDVTRNLSPSFQYLRSEVQAMSSPPVAS